MIRTNYKHALIPLTALVALAVGNAPSARADVTQTYTYTYPSSGTALTDLINIPMPLTQFDTSLGILTGVNLSYSFAENQSGTVKNNATGSQNFKVTATTNYFLSDPGANQLLFKDAVNSQTYTGLASGASSTFGPFNPSNSVSVVLGPGDGSLFTQFKGNGTITLRADTTSGTTILGGGGNIQTTIVTNTSVTASVFYTYTVPQVPEPGTIGLFASMLMVGGGFGARRLIRKKAQKAE